MEFRVYAAFGYVTKVVNNGRVNAELHATGCRALARYAVSQNFILRNVDASNDFRIIVALPIATLRYDVRLSLSLEGNDIHRLTST